MVYQGILLAKYMRYFYPLYPILCAFAGLFTFETTDLFKRKNKILGGLISVLLIVIIFIWPLSFTAIYLRPHSRIIASQWIYQNIPPGAKITSEEWDDGLPLGIPGYQSLKYTNIPLGLYNTENLEKWQRITQEIIEADYIIMSSNRLFDSIPKLPERYPVASLYYQLLFKEKLGFRKVAEITSYPCFPPITKPLFCLNDSSAEESFTVYDHPKIAIFKKENFSRDLLQPFLDQKLINQARYVNPAETNRLF